MSTVFNNCLKKSQIKTPLKKGALKIVFLVLNCAVVLSGGCVERVASVGRVAFNVFCPFNIAVCGIGQISRF